MTSGISFQALSAHDFASRQSLIFELQQKGFARIRLDEPHLADALSAALDDAEALPGFRFPPIDESAPHYTPVRRGAFYALYEAARACLAALVAGEEQPTWLKDALEKEPAHLLQKQEELESRGGLATEDLLDPSAAFADSFFNLFNYDNGALNPHADRSLVTAIFVRPASDPHHQSALWVENGHGQWTNADAQLQDKELMVMVGEDFEALGCAEKLGLYGAQHAVRVDPEGEFIEHSHFRRDPASAKAQNRKSAAFILRQEPS